MSIFGQTISGIHLGLLRQRRDRGAGFLLGRRPKARDGGFQRLQATRFSRQPDSPRIAAHATFRDVACAGWNAPSAGSTCPRGSADCS